MIIGGKIVHRGGQREQPTVETSTNGQVQEGEHPLGDGVGPILTTLSFTASPKSTKISVEREPTGHATFTRSITLPTQVDASKASAKLLDGVLTLTVPRVGRIRIDVE